MGIEMCETYNGWSNRETWAVALHLSNDPGLYSWARETVSEFGDSLDSAREFASYVEFLVSRSEYERENGAGSWSRDLELMAQDIGSLWRVEWREVVKSFLDEV